MNWELLVNSNPELSSTVLRSRTRIALAAAACSFLAQTAAAQAVDAPADPAAPPADPAAKPKPPPYSLPWQLRPVVAATVLRSDTTFAFYKASPTVDESGSTIASMLLFSYKVMEGLAPLLRLGVVSNSPPDVPNGPDSATLFINPVLGGTFAPKIHDKFKLGLFLGFALPLGQGGGNSPAPKDTVALAAGIAARSAMDNAMFAVNYFTVFPGVGFAYVDHGLTLQAEATLLQLTKARGPDAADDSNTNLTFGFHAGYFVIPQLSFGAEIRQQRWLSTPTSIKVAGVVNDDLRDTTTFAVGPRVHVKVGEKSWFRPGIAFAMPLDKPMSDRDYKIVQLDLPFVF
jgi:hypothetical protein